MRRWRRKCGHSQTRGPLRQPPSRGCRRDLGSRSDPLNFVMRWRWRELLHWPRRLGRSRKSPGSIIASSSSLIDGPPRGNQNTARRLCAMVSIMVAIEASPEAQDSPVHMLKRFSTLRVSTLCIRPTSTVRTGAFSEGMVIVCCSTARAIGAMGTRLLSCARDRIAMLGG